MWISSSTSSENYAIPSSSLPTKLYVCCCFLGLLFNQTRSGAWTNGTPCHSIPCSH